MKRRSAWLVAALAAAPSIISFSRADEPPQVQAPATATASSEAADRIDPVVAARRVVLNFREEAWLPALTWLAQELNLNLDWQQLPEGTLSLHSTKDYSLSEAEDLINMQLLGRGFTLLKRGEVLRLVPLKDIDITLVPRVDAGELEKLERHQVVRVTLPLEWMLADEAAKEFKPLLSPYGQMFPMASTNRLEVLDAVVNLRELVRLLTKAESADSRRSRVAEFKLKFRKPDDIAAKVRQVLGLPPDGREARYGQTQLDIEQARFKAEAVKQLGTNARELLTDNKKPDVFIVVNDEESSLLVNAPPDKLELVRQTIEALDKPLPPVESPSTWETISRVKVHPVAGFDPETVSKLLLSLQERGNLAKETRIQHEPAYNRIIAFASPEDQLTIAQLIESFRAEKRSAAVLSLNSVTPQYAVSAIQLILKNPQRPIAPPAVAIDGQFQIEADPENSRLLLWATPDELSEVRQFLAQLGEGPAETTPTAQMHVVSLGGGDLDAMTKRMKVIWSEISDSPLIIEGREKEARQDKDKSDSTGAESNQPTVPAPVESSSVPPLGGPNNESVSQDSRLVSTVAASDTGKAPDEKEAPAAGSPPVRIIEGPQGDVVIVSRDPAAAAKAKRLLEQFMPGPDDVHVVALKHSQAYPVKRQLEEMLGISATAIAASKPVKLSSARPLTIDVDTRTNRLLIQHATPQQLKLVKEFIPLLDQPVQEDARLVRQQRVYRFKYRRASEVAETVKEVYRDLLSINDRVFASYANSRPVGYNQNVAATATNPEYQGLLSVGVDSEANLLIISAPGYLIEDVVKLAESVDTPSDGPALAVIPRTGDSSDAKFKEAISRILKKR
ncbi:MAG: secretin N-terminal domain-containing protein [Pirellulales bacterium]